MSVFKYFVYLVGLIRINFLGLGFIGFVRLFGGGVLKVVLA